MATSDVFNVSRVQEIPRDYNNGHKYRGKAIIANFAFFDQKITTCSLVESRVDVDNLRRTLQIQQFFVEVWGEGKMTKKNFQEKLATLARDESHKEAECLVIVVMSHGNNKGVMYASDDHFTVKDVWSNFTAEKCTLLAKKPKLFFFHACRGKEYSQCIRAHAHGSMEELREDQYSIPAEADFFHMFSTVEGKVSFGGSEHGSPFVNSLCEVLIDDGKKPDQEKDDLLHLTTYVSKKTASYEYKEDKGGKVVKQQPTIVSTLIRFYYLKNKDQPMQ